MQFLAPDGAKINACNKLHMKPRYYAKTQTNVGFIYVQKLHWVKICQLVPKLHVADFWL